MFMLAKMGEIVPLVMIFLPVSILTLTCIVVFNRSAIAGILGGKREILRTTYVVESSLFTRLLVRAGVLFAVVAALALFYTSSVEVHISQFRTSYEVGSSLFPHLEEIRTQDPFCDYLGERYGYYVDEEFFVRGDGDDYSEECFEYVVRW